MKLLICAPRQLKIKFILAVLLLFILNALLYYHIHNRTRAVISPLPLTGAVVAIDPGHGGYDPGFSNKLVEKEVNLQISLFLREFLQQGGAKVVMTRETDKDYAHLPVGPFKKNDLDQRLKIIAEAGKIDALVSIHANSFYLPQYRGAQTFYYAGEECKRLAFLIQEELIRVLQNTDRQIMTADFYILKYATCPAVLVETGFISNPEERGLLGRSEYQQKVAWAIYLGIIRFIKE